jgi:hypothetical protein
MPSCGSVLSRPLRNRPMAEPIEKSHRRKALAPLEPAPPRGAAPRDGSAASHSGTASGARRGESRARRGSRRHAYDVGSIAQTRPLRWLREAAAFAFRGSLVATAHNRAATRIAGAEFGASGSRGRKFFLAAKPSNYTKLDSLLRRFTKSPFLSATRAGAALYALERGLVQH